MPDWRDRRSHRSFSIALAVRSVRIANRRQAVAHIARVIGDTEHHSLHERWLARALRHQRAGPRRRDQPARRLVVELPFSMSGGSRNT